MASKLSGGMRTVYTGSPAEADGGGAFSVLLRCGGSGGARAPTSTSRLGMRGGAALRGFHVGAREIARTGGGIRLKRLNLAAGEAHRAALRNDHALVGKLRFDAHRAARGEHAHFAALFEAQRHVARPSGNRDRRGNNRRRVDRESVRGFQRWMNAAIIERQRHRAGGLDQLEMRGAANADFAAGIQQKKGMSGAQRDVAAAGDDRWRGVRFNSRRSCRYDFEVIAFDPPDDGRKILRGNVGVPDGKRRHDRQQGGRENLRPKWPNAFSGSLRKTQFTCSFLKGVVRLS